MFGYIAAVTKKAEDNNSANINNANMLAPVNSLPPTAFKGQPQQQPAAQAKKSVCGSGGSSCGTGGGCKK